MLRYIQNTLNHGILYRANNDEGLIGYSDSDWGGDQSDRKSTTGVVFTLNRGLITWELTKQAIVATSTVKAEYIALSQAAKEALWIKQLLQEMGIYHPTVLIRMDSKGAMDFAANAQFSKRTKHIDIRHHFIRDHLEKGDISLEWVPTEDMTADILTKPLDRKRFMALRDRLGVYHGVEPTVLSNALAN